MHLEGNHTFNSTQEGLWSLLNDPAVLARTTPGIRELEPLGGDRFKAVMDIKMGPIKSLFNGTLEVVDKEEPKSYRLLIDVDAKIGTVSAQAGIALRPREDGTALFFEADTKLSGLLARMGQRVLSGVARLFTSQFFKALEQELSGAKTLEPVSPQGRAPN